MSRKKLGVTARLEMVLGPRLDGWSQRLPCGCILSTERFLLPCPNHKNSLPSLEPQANVEEKKAAFLEAARNWFSCKLDPVKVGNRESHWYEAAVKAYRALEEEDLYTPPSQNIDQ